MATRHEFQPDWTSAPGDTIADILGERNISLDDFAKRIEQSSEYTDELLQGRAAITIAVARKLEHVLGASVEFWISRDFQYREDVARHSAVEKAWLDDLPVGDMIKFGWLKPKPRPAEEIEACLNFFGVPSVLAWRTKYGDLQQMVAFRNSRSFDSRPAAVTAWLRRGEVESDEINCNSWDPKRFQDSLQSIRSLTRNHHPDRFIPKLRQICAAGGVAVAVVRAPSGCRASGATRFLNPSKALLLLSFRFLRDDHFWFSFFHEAGHLLLHGNRGFFLESDDQVSTMQEKEANDFAERVLIPPEFRNPLLDLPANAIEVIKFARKVGISPGIVVGQLQHHKIITHRQLNSLIKRFTWAE